MAETYTFEVNLMDESFNPKETHNYGLAILLNEISMGFCVLDFRRNKFLGLQRALLHDPKSREIKQTHFPDFTNFLDDIRTNTPWLRNTFKLVKVAYDGQQATLVPAALFNPEDNEQYFKFNFKAGQDELILGDHLMPLDAWQIFSVPKPLTETIREVFPKTKMMHASSLLIESIWINYKNRISSPHVFLNVRDTLVDLMIFDGKSMSYFNTFPFQNAEEVTYYLVFVLEQLNFNPEKVPLILFGFIDKNEGLSELLLRYVRHVETGLRNEAYSYSYMLNRLPRHEYFPLLNAFSCGL